MYRPGSFAEDDPAALAALMRDHPLATLVVHGGQGLCAAYVPLAAETGGDGGVVRLVGHVARANPFWSHVDDGAEVLALFAGPDAYVSPSMYASKREHGKVVPTWNYARVEARGRLFVESDPARVRPYFEAPTRRMEQDRAEPWAVDDAPDRYIETLSHALVGLRIEVSGIAGAFKLSQNRSDADRLGVCEALETSSNPSEAAVAAMMTARDH